MRDRADRMIDLLTRAFAPPRLVVRDVSERHAGHAGAAPGGQTHYEVVLVSSRFEGQTRVARTRLVNDVLAAEYDGGLHALALALRTPAEDAGA